MSKERLGKFEKWVITHTYLKAKGELPSTWKYPRGYEDTEELRRVLWKAEVLLNCFNCLPLSNRRPEGRALEKFKDTKEYRNALTIFNRAINRLERKGYIQVWIDKEKRTLSAVSLGGDGRIKAEKLYSQEKEMKGSVLI